jgi:hypothetical protein
VSHPYWQRGIPYSLQLIPSDAAVLPTRFCDARCTVPKTPFEAPAPAAQPGSENP